MSTIWEIILLHQAYKLKKKQVERESFKLRNAVGVESIMVDNRQLYGTT